MCLLRARSDRLADFEWVRIESTSLILSKECTTKNFVLRFHTASAESGHANYIIADDFDMHRVSGGAFGPWTPLSFF
jgi:hypothetical protein